MSNTNYKPIFAEEQYNSRDGFNVNFWGKILWNFLHTISFNADPISINSEDREKYNEFLLSLRHVLPCKSCRENYAKNLEELGYNKDIVLENRRSFSMFIYRLHNQVNKMLGKPCTLTYDQVRDRYEMFRARCYNETPIIPKYSIDGLEQKETGCETPMTGIKSKSIIAIVPITTKCDAFKVDPKCIPKKISKKNK